MEQIKVRNRCYFSPWTGSAPINIETLQGVNQLVMGIHCQIGKFKVKTTALLDTAAQWSVIGGELAQMILADKTLSVPTHISISLSTRLGKFTGNVHRIEINLIAEKGLGHDLMVDGSFIVTPDWKGPMVLGFHGFMERIRFAIDPGVSNNKQGYIYFAAP